MVGAAPGEEGITRRAAGTTGVIALEVGGLGMTATAEIMGNENFRVEGTGMNLDNTNKNIHEDRDEAMTMKWNTVEDGGCCPMPGKEKGLRCSCLKTWVCRGDSLISR
jgi:hypothetical protein